MIDDDDTAGKRGDRQVALGVFEPFVVVVPLVRDLQRRSPRHPALEREAPFRGRRHLEVGIGNRE